MNKLTIEELLNSNQPIKEQSTTGFFTDNYPAGYESKSNFQQYLMDQKNKGGRTNWRLNHLNSFFQNAKQGRRLVRMPEVVWDEGENWMWCKFTFGKITQNLKIADGGGMHALIKDYALGKVKITYDLKDLFSMASTEEV